MLLKRDSSENFSVKNKICMEKVVDDLLMISVRVNSKKRQAYYDYWRLTKTIGIPPLEVGIDRTNDTIQTIVFYVDSTSFKETKFNGTTENTGLIIIDPSIFKKENDYVDVNSSYFVFCNDNEFICSFVSDFDPDVAYKADRVKVFLKSNKVVGFSIVDLTSREIRKLKSI